MSNMKSRVLAASIVAVLGVTAFAVAASSANPAADRARGLVDNHAAQLARADGDAFVVRDVIVDRDGTEHVRFDRTFLGLPVLGGDVVMHSHNGQFKAASLTLKDHGRPNIAARVRADDAIVEAGAQFGAGFKGTPTARKVIYARGAKPVLAWEVAFSGEKADQTPTDMHYIVDATSGRVLDKWDTIETTAANGTGNSLYSGAVALGTNSITGGYELRDTTRGGTYTTDFNNGGTSKSGTGTIFTDADNVWGTGTTASRASAGVDAHYGVATTWDYYKAVHGRNGIANDGKGAYNRTHVGRNYVNAFWSDGCFCMSYGDGDGVTYGPLVNLDVAGHEMTHGVTSRTANLTYSGESGGLNESNSDIFGTMVEFYANNAKDPGDYRIGEMLYLTPSPTKAFRFMYQPSLEGAGRSVDCWYSGIGSLDVHYSSGPSNHYFYLLAEGSAPKAWPEGTHGSPTCNGSTVAGIGRDAAAKIQYRALTVYFTSSTNYAGDRVASLKAATDLYGAGSTQYNAVAAAWSAVGVN